MKSTVESRIREIPIADIDRSRNHRLSRMGGTRTANPVFNPRPTLATMPPS